MMALWRTVLSEETRKNILDNRVLNRSTADYEVHECGCTIILRESAFVLCTFHVGFEEGVLAVRGRRKGRKQ